MSSMLRSIISRISYAFVLPVCSASWSSLFSVSASNLTDVAMTALLCEYVYSLYHMHSEMERFCVRKSEEHTSELQSLMRISYAVFCLKKKRHRSHNPS